MSFSAQSRQNAQYGVQRRNEAEIGIKGIMKKMGEWSTHINGDVTLNHKMQQLTPEIILQASMGQGVDCVLFTDKPSKMEAFSLSFIAYNNIYLPLRNVKNNKKPAGNYLE